ncbi:MAG: aldehyde dehydrogenase family protein [Bdellovibrionales bacterium]|nr:aldehyde dehydrogenase family protein [Bdellovibrionales bacterium]
MTNIETKNNGTQEETYGKTIVAYNIIENEQVCPIKDEYFSSTNPSQLLDCVAQVPASTKQDVQMAVQSAKRAFASWKQTPSPIRGTLIGRLGQLIEKHKTSLAHLMTREMGKTRKEAMGEVQEAIDTCHFFQSEGRRLYGQTVPSEMRNKELFTYRRPYGVVAMITPSNFPLAVASWKAIPALLAGNTLVWKSPPEAPAIAYLFSLLFLEAGFPKGCINLIHGDAGVGQMLMEEVDQGNIQKVSFTGSTRVGKIIGEICGRNLQTPSLELGGKNPLVVMEDANLDLAVHGAVWASYGTAGQRCTSAGNIILHKSIAAKFVQEFVKQSKAIKIGNPNLDESVLYGPMIDKHYFDHFMEHFEKAQKDGAKLIMGDGRITKDHKPENFSGDPENGYYLWPTLWENIKIDDWLAQNEVFGPCVGIIEVGSIEEAIECANGTNYGLSSAIYTQNRMYAYQFKSQIQSGMCSINNSTTGAEAHLPFGGMKNSGNGTRESGIWVLDAFTQWQAVNDELSGKLQLAQMDTEMLDQELSSNLQLDEIIPGARS